LKDPKKKNIRDELINTTIDLLGTICGGVGTTKLKEMIEIAGTMAVVYPNMFGTVEHDGDDDHEGNVEKEDLCGYGESETNLSLKDLAQKMVYRFRDRVSKPMKRVSRTEVADEPPKKGKKAEIYGVDNTRFAGKKITAATVAALARASAEDDFETREAAYEKKRPEIQYHFKSVPFFVTLMFQELLQRC